MKELNVGDIIYTNGGRYKVFSINGDKVNVGNYKGSFFEQCETFNINEVKYDEDYEEHYIDIKLMVGSIVTLDINDHEYTVINIEDNVATMKRQGDIKHYHLSDINYDVSYGWGVCSGVEETMSATDKRKLAVYEVQDNVYEYNSLDELKEIYSLLGNPTVKGQYGLDYENINVFIDSLQCSFGLLVFWKEWDNELGYEYKRCKIIKSAVIKEGL